jgi:hypothetical protein
MRNNANVLGEVGNKDSDDDQAARVMLVRCESSLRFWGLQYTDITGWKMPGEASSRQYGVFGSMVLVVGDQGGVREMTLEFCKAESRALMRD